MSKMKLKLTQKVKDEFTEKIKNYFLNVRDEEIGDLAAMLFLDFITENIGKEYYNQGIRDCIAQLSDNVEDLKGLEL